MEIITNNIGSILGIVMILAFSVNIIVQVTKDFILLPTKLWCIVVSASLIIGCVLSVMAIGYIKFSFLAIILAIAGSFIVAFIAMYGFDTFRELWERFKKGENIND
ncbi:MAG: hypothetical protein E7394_00120 [Ruminococcaceae bacterium]|nr:hypothetical protein [Oscillospiraceae bacterium]